MSKIKVKDNKNKTIKTLNKSITATQKFKENIVDVKDKDNESSSEYANNRIGDASNKVFNVVKRKTKEIGNKSVEDTKKNLSKIKTKYTQLKNKGITPKGIVNKIKNSKNNIKTTKDKIKTTGKIIKESIKSVEKAKKLAIESAKRTTQAIKGSIKFTISSIKLILSSTKALITALIAGGWVAIIAIVVICLVGLLCGSIFGIFLSSEGTGNGLSMKNVVKECNQEFSNKLQSIQDQNPHDEFVLDGSMSNWKDVLIVYTVKMSNGKNETDVVTLNGKKKGILKSIFWEMNEISFEVKDENVIEKGTNANEMPKEVQKKVLHIKINSKNMNDMKIKYNFNLAQQKQLAELSNSKYDSLWGGVIYGLNNNSSGDGYKTWRQSGMNWSNIKIGSTNSTISDIGCLVTSIAILIAKSGVPTGNIKDFNPGTFVEALNQNGGFDRGGNLQYGAISRVIPNFKYVGKVNLRGKSRDDKFHLISGYLNQGYYLTAEVKGATAGNQHWVAIIDIDLNNIIMVDPASNQTILWNAYEWSKSSQFNYFKAE